MGHPPRRRAVASIPVTSRGRSPKGTGMRAVDGVANTNWHPHPEPPHPTLRAAFSPLGRREMRSAPRVPFSPAGRRCRQADEGATPTAPNQLFAIRYSLLTIRYQLLTHPKLHQLDRLEILHPAADRCCVYCTHCVKAGAIC